MVQQEKGNPASIPVSGGLYSGYAGALECLSAGYGDVLSQKIQQSVHTVITKTSMITTGVWILASMSRYQSLVLHHHIL